MDTELKLNTRTEAKEKMIEDLMKKYQLHYDDARLLFKEARYITKKYKAGLYDVSDIIVGAWVNSKPFNTFAEFMRLFIEEIEKPEMKEMN